MTRYPEVTIDQIIETIPRAERTDGARNLIQRAYTLAVKAHSGQMRRAGGDYIQHPLTVALLLAELGMDSDTIAAALLHDTVEDSTEITLDTITQRFGPGIASLVDGVTKLDQIEQRRIDRFSDQSEKARDERESESLRKMFMAMAEDVRVVIIKLADRLHNMRTLDGLPPDRQVSYARETMDIFAPLANRLGVWQWKWELEDLSLRYTDPDTYNEIASFVEQRRTEREKSIQHHIEILERQLKEQGIDAELTGRPKHIYSIYGKMQRKHVPFSQIYDIRGIRVLTQAIPDCYHVLGIVHGLWKPVPGEFDDYIATPKDNLYQSLHTAVIGEDGKALEVQIRTHEMHRIAEFGVAAHWKYKEKGGQQDEAFDRRIAWLRSMMDWRQEVTDASEFLDAMRTDVFQDRVYVFTPKGKLIDLPVGATPIDFAYHVHTEIGHRARGARINDKWGRLDQPLHTGDRVEIITGKKSAPSRDWLNPALGYTKTTRARSKIRQWFRRQDREQNIIQGRESVERELKRLGLEQISHETVARLFDYRSIDDFHAAVGFGDINSNQIANRIAQIQPQKQEAEELPIIPRPPASSETVEGIQVQGTGGLLTRLAKCCHPLPGDDIIGYVTRGRGVTVHRRDCPSILGLRDDDRLIEVTWGKHQETIPVTLEISAYDRTGLLHEISGIISSENINIGRSAVSPDRRTNIAKLYITIEVNDIAQLSRVLTKIDRLPNVIDAHRHTG
ncbi:MAG: bifunctional (p)ppGpp synthetase/guanosine-3',5'-bis(diphosphate) 3'-pyrophosphohydrolase [Chloroflexi bacterium]|nr:bifunctional (p)ppGpp synthetase/guanosine-3',5'-bis(diphosphate) 3'-pyrophosphohydrolase [Chloroflexota bacterium]